MSRRTLALGSRPPSGVAQEAVVGYLAACTGWVSSLLETVNQRPGESPGRGLELGSEPTSARGLTEGQALLAFAACWEATAEWGLKINKLLRRDGEPPETPFILLATWKQVLPNFSLGLILVKQTPFTFEILDHSCCKMLNYNLGKPWQRAAKYPVHSEGFC